MNPIVRTVDEHAAARVSPLTIAYTRLAKGLFSQITGPAVDVIGVTTIARQAGASVVAKNLALATALGNAHHTLLITSERTPELRTSAWAGCTLDEVLCTDAEWTEAIASTSHPRLFVTRYGDKFVSAEATAADSLREALRLRFDRVIIDLPTVDIISHSVSMSTLAGHVILVVEPDSVSQQEARTARAKLDACGARLLGVVVNKA